MNQLIGCCGLDCEACDARIATVTNDGALREKTAALWTELNGVPITPENFKISDRATIVFPYHRALDGLEEARLKDKKYGSTLREGCPTLGRIAANTPSVLDSLKRLRREK